RVVEVVEVVDGEDLGAAARVHGGGLGGLGDGDLRARSLGPRRRRRRGDPRVDGDQRGQGGDDLRHWGASWPARVALAASAWESRARRAIATTLYCPGADAPLTVTLTRAPGGHAMALTLAEANRVVERAVAKARELNIRISVAVCDAGGRLVAFNRMDGAIWASVYGSQGKAIASA